MVRLFEKTAAGLLVEIDPALAEAARAGRRVNRVVNAEYDVLFTAVEEAARDAEDAAFAAAAQQRDAEAAERRAAVEAKLKVLDISPEDLKSLLT